MWLAEDMDRCEGMSSRPVEAGKRSRRENPGFSSTVIAHLKGNDRKKKDTLAEGWIADHPRIRRVSESIARRGEGRDLSNIAGKETSSAVSVAV